MARERQAPLWQRAIILLSGMATALVLVMALVLGRSVLIPIALAGLLTFPLNPAVRFLHKRGVPHIGSVLLAVSLTGVVLMAFGAMVTRQIASVLAEIPQNTANIKAKVKSLRQMSSGPFIESFVHMVDEVSKEFAPPDAPANSDPGDTTVAKQAGPAPLQYRPDSTSWQALPGYVGSFLEVLATLAFALVLLVFFLLGRDDLRDRLVLLAGKSRLTLTSKALEDISQRVGKYIVVVALLNGGFGILLTAGLFALQVPYALLWGFLAGVLRFIPYIGPWVGALFPVLMSLSAFEGWWIPALVLGYVLILELISNNVIEPLAFGQSTGVSPTALVVSAAFWLFLWGPVGLVLSAPFAVCLVVLGRNIPQLAFLQILLGDAPALRAHVGLYQRLMLGDSTEAASILLDRAKTAPMAEVCDELLLPALNCLRRDFQRGHVTDSDEKTVLDGIEATLLRIETRENATAAAAEAENFPLTTPGTVPDLASISALDPAPAANWSSPLTVTRVRLFGYPAVDDIDRVALEMLRQSLAPDIWDWEAGSVDTLASELAARMTVDPPDIVLIGALPPGGLAQARYLCKRLRDAAPELTIVVGRWGLSRNKKLDCERLGAAGASFVATTMTETIRILESRRLLLIHKDAPSQSVDPAPSAALLPV
jgi:predicted PurR-regulated permease PerM